MITLHLDILDGKLIQVCFQNDDDLMRMMRFMNYAKSAIERTTANTEAQEAADAIYGRVK